ncbi:hypothetical protein CKO51_15240 [Rhodopirellula sp. SM50]|nr:hypothetical protein [Rhodopirellula sp. SM50]PAY18678.1 hypothetical protein CKO51_15240 [Rhodopirellula sp. SM50]
MIGFQTAGDTAEGCHISASDSLSKHFDTAPDDLHWRYSKLTTTTRRSIGSDSGGLVNLETPDQPGLTLRMFLQLVWVEFDRRSGAMR